MISVSPEFAGKPADSEVVRVTASLKGKKVATAQGRGELQLKVPSAKLWSPAHPVLYDLSIVGAVAPNTIHAVSGR